MPANNTTFANLLFINGLDVQYKKSCPWQILNPEPKTLKCKRVKRDGSRRFKHRSWILQVFVTGLLL